MNIQLEEKLAQLRKKWVATKDPTRRLVLEKQARALKIAQELGNSIYEKAKDIFEK